MNIHGPMKYPLPKIPPPPPPPPRPKMPVPVPGMPVASPSDVVLAAKMAAEASARLTIWLMERLG